MYGYLTSLHGRAIRCFYQKLPDNFNYNAAWVFYLRCLFYDHHCNYASQGARALYSGNPILGAMMLLKAKRLHAKRRLFASIVRGRNRRTVRKNYETVFEILSYESPVQQELLAKMKTKKNTRNEEVIHAQVLRAEA